MAVAALDLKWPPDVFWRATPHEFWAVFELAIERKKES